MRIYKKGFNAYRVFLLVILTVLLECSNANIYAEKESSVSSRNQFTVAIFREEGFPGVGIPLQLTPEWLNDFLSSHYSVTYLDLLELSDRRYLNLNNFDLLILPYGEAFPYEAFSCIKEYLYEGGGLFNISGRPFWMAMKNTEGRWQKMEAIDPYKEFLSPLGIKYYEFLNNQDIGLSVTTSLAYSPITPTHGNVFPYRIPVRDFYSLEAIAGKKNDQLIVFIKSWNNPYAKDSKDIPQKWCLIGAKGDKHPLNPNSALAAETLIKIMEYLSSRIIIYELETDLAAYHQKEKVRASVKVMNYGKNKEECFVGFVFLDTAGKVVYEKNILIELEAGQRKTLSDIWAPDWFRSNFYRVIATLNKKNKILDKEENGFVVINEDILRSGPSIQIDGNKFLIDGRITYLVGINYYESKLGELIWVRPNILKIRKDFESMKALGVNFVRIHYHHSKWFRDYFAYVIKEEITPYLQVVDTTALPSERSMRILDAIIQLAQEQGLIFCMDIFSLVPEEMGESIGWLGLKERILNKDKIAVQNKFIGIIASRYKDVPGITWDLWNEPRLDKNDLELLRNWVKEIKAALRENGDNHPITIGDDLSLYLLDVLDYASIHTYEPAEFSSLKDLGKPFIFQEVWNDAGCSLSDEMKQAEELNNDFNAFLETGAAGFVPWQWTRQARLWNNTSDAEEWDDELGICVHDDGSLKPAGRAYFSLISIIKDR